MPFVHFCYLALAAVGITLATRRGLVHPWLALLAASLLFALLCGMSVGQTGKSFGTGFGQSLNALGLPVLAAAMVAILGGRGTAPPAMLAALGVLAGTGASIGAAFAVLTPLRAPDRSSALTLGLALNAGQGLLLPSPVVVAATAILAADWRDVLVFGAPLAVASALCGAVFAHRVTPAVPRRGNVDSRPPSTAARAGACLLMAAMLVVQSLGDMPGEPLGGGSARELLLGIGRPVVVLAVGVGLMIVATRAWRAGGLSETGWTAVALTNAAPLMLLLGVAGGLQSLTQTAHMAELLAEKLLPAHFPSPFGLLLPFLVAAVMKLGQGSSLVAAITAAGMMQGLLPALGLDQPTARALAVLSVGAGAVAGAHVNDGFFWLVADGAGLRPGRALALVTGGTMLQGAFAALALLGIGIVRLA